MKVLREVVRLLIEQQYQSHTLEPKVGDYVTNTNKRCKHFRSSGHVMSVASLPSDMGKTVEYQCINSGATWKIGDILVKTMDQLSPSSIRESLSSEDFRDVYNTARMAHVGQTRRDGSEYFSHPSEVRNIARSFYPKDSVVQLAALLHDSLEDAPGSTVSSAEEMEEFIRGSIQDPSSANEVIRVVRALTHEKGSSYTDYVVSLLGDTPTLRVKLADMVHNLTDNPSPKQKMKYKSALAAISQHTSGKPPSGITSQHWDKLMSLAGSK